MSWPSSQIASCHENGTYSSAMSICSRGLVMPAMVVDVPAQPARRPPGGPGRGPGKLGGSLPRRRAEDPRRRATVGRGRLAAGLVGEHDRARAVGRRARLEEADRLPHHRGLLHLLDRDVLDLQVRVRVLQRVLAVLDRDLPPDVLGRAAAVDVGADERGERAAGAERRAPPAAERELRVALGLLLERDREHASRACAPGRARRRRSPVVPPTEPAVCTRNIGLPTAPSASDR